MLPRLLDAAGFQRAANLSADEFSEAALSGLIPRASATFAGIPLWIESNVATFCKEASRAFSNDWSNGHALVPSEEAQAIIAARAAAVPVVESIPVASGDRWPDEMTREMAMRYCEVNGAFLDKHRDLLPHRRDGMYVVFKRSDLDAFKQLPVYLYRKRNGYRAGVPISEIAKAREARTKADQALPSEPKAPTGYATGAAMLSEKAAADHLNVHPEVLAIARKDKLGPAFVFVAGNACYRVDDLNAWKAEQEAKAPKSNDESPDVEMDTDEAAAYLGVTRHSLQNWRVANAGPRVARRSGAGRATRIFYMRSELDQFKRSHATSIERSQRMSANPNCAGPHPTTGTGHRRGKPTKAAAKSSARVSTRSHGAQAKHPAPNGTRVRH